MSAADVPPYAELAAATNFSFLRGASHPQHMVLAALLLGQSGIGIADRNTVAGVVRAHSALRQLREDGAPPPEKVREGSGPGEYTFVEPSHSLDLVLTEEELKSRAKAFRVAVGTRLVFADGTPDIVAYPTDRAASAASSPSATAGRRRASASSASTTSSRTRPASS